ncbi:GNAT family N-acetyltransferase [Actinoplanes sp. NPDC051494]|uniref:GNAT family N-acetyltransferase n=1 Tax=Actinoplanes sp. NPDC051494 TaxID=3363907 RepID=UPI0037A3D621
MKSISTDRLTALSEQVEAEFMHAYLAGAPAGLAPAPARIGGGVALAMAADPTRAGYWNKALGFGIAEPVTTDVIARVAEHFRVHGNGRAVLQVAPSVLPADWDDIRAEHGLTLGSSWVKLGARATDIRSAPTDLRVGRVGGDDAREWATVVLETFGMPAGELTEMLVAAVRHPGFHPYAAWDGDRIVATGNLFVAGSVASLNTGATLPAYRGRGAQSALLAARGAAAREAGCEWVISETGLPTEGTRNTSLVNMRRMGLRDLYVRDNWMWEDK